MNVYNRANPNKLNGSRFIENINTNNSYKNIADSFKLHGNTDSDTATLDTGMGTQEVVSYQRVLYIGIGKKIKIIIIKHI